MPVDPRLEHDIGCAEAPGGKPVLTAYKDSLGIWTIGRGHRLYPADTDWTGYAITAASEQVIFDTDIDAAGRFAAELPEWGACDTDCRRNALIELCFNMRGKWLGFHNARAAWQEQRWADAGAAMLDSEWAREVGERAQRLANYVASGAYP